MAKSDESEKPTAVAQILTTVLTAGAGWLATKLVRKLWGGKNGSAPKGATDPNSSAVAAVAFAAVAAAVGAIAQRAATKGASNIASHLTAGSNEAKHNIAERAKD